MSLGHGVAVQTPWLPGRQGRDEACPCGWVTVVNQGLMTTRKTFDGSSSAKAKAAAASSRAYSWLIGVMGRFRMAIQ